MAAVEEDHRKLYDSSKAQMRRAKGKAGIPGAVVARMLQHWPDLTWLLASDIHSMKVSLY